MTRITVAIIALSMVQCKTEQPDATALPVASSAPPVASAAPPPRASAKPRPNGPRPKAPAGFVEVTVKAVIPSTQGNAVMLVDGPAKHALLVFVGDTEALSIHLRLEGERYARPLTHDLMDHVLSGLGARVQSARVDRLDNDIYFGVVSIDQGGKLRDYDSRASDAIALALGNDAPIFVASEVMKRASVELDESGMPAGSASGNTDSGKSPIAL